MQPAAGPGWPRPRPPLTCLLDLAVQGLRLPLVTTPCQGGVATEAIGWSGGASFGRGLGHSRLCPLGGARARRGLAAATLSLQ